MPHLRLLATGGTIASRHEVGGRRPTASGADVLANAAVPPDCRVDVEDVTAVGSFAWQWSDLLGLARHVEAALADGVDGVVVTHGTDAMEEVAFLISLLHDDSRPVVFTGAQRPFDHPAADGPANLGDALLVASSPTARDRAVLLAFDGQVHPARGVTKVDTLSTRGFDSPGRGPVLRVAGGRVLPLSPSGRPAALPVDSSRTELPRVDVVPVYVGADAAQLRGAVDAGARGLVLAALGSGNATPAILEAVRECGLPVLVCSRVLSGPVLPIYGGGGGADLAEAGALFADDLSPWQGRMLLAVALSVSPDDPLHQVRQWLAS